jgi:hypothetical protein
LTVYYATVIVPDIPTLPTAGSFMPTRNPQVRSNQGQIKRLEALVNAAKILNTTLDLDKLLALILDLATRNLKAARGTIYLIDI